MATAKPPRENILLNLACSLVLPTLILTKASGPEWLGPRLGLVVALAFPIGYGLWDYSRRRQANFITLVGLASVLLSGSMGLLEIDAFWFAIKEAAMPALIGSAVFLTAHTRRPLVHSLLYNDQIVATDRVDEALQRRGTRPAFDQLLRQTSYGLAATFFASALGNFFMARYLVRSAPGTEAFNQELGRMNFIGNLSLMVPAILMMMFLLFRLLKGLERLTGLTQDDLLAAGRK